MQLESLAQFAVEQGSFKADKQIGGNRGKEAKKAEKGKVVELNNNSDTKGLDKDSSIITERTQAQEPIAADILREQQEKINKDNERIRKLAEELNKKVPEDKEVKFGVHEETKRMTIKIVDRNSKKVLKEYPPEETLDMMAKIWKQAGMVVDEKM